jgi:hypothetical protein
MRIEYSFYCDESGMFNARDTHVICPLVVRDSALGVEELLEFWRTELGDGDWQAFHSVSMKNLEVESLFNKFYDKLFKPGYIYPVYTCHKNEISYGFDFYPTMIIKLVLWQCNVILDEIIASIIPSADEEHSIDENKMYHIDIKLYRAGRTVINHAYLKRILQRTIRNVVREKLKAKKIALDIISFHFFPYVQPIETSPFIQISDALSYVIRGYLNDGLTMTETKDRAKRIPYRELQEGMINNHDMRQLCKDLVSPIVKKKVVEIKEKVVEKTITKIVKSKQPEYVVPISTHIVEQLQNKEKSGKTIDSDTFSDFLKPIMKQQQWVRLIEFDSLYQIAYKTIRDERRYDFGEVLIELLYSFMGEEAKADDVDERWLRGNELRVADLFLTVSNHRGYDLSNDLRIKRAFDISKELENYTRHWGDICTFHNHLAIAFQNVFRFEETIEALFPRVDYLQAQGKNPFTGGNLKAYEIGALFGTYAQSLALGAHCRFFNEGENALKNLEDAELFSMLAAEHFEKPEDREKQDIYQAHFKMQRYILAGDNNALKEAHSILESPQMNLQAVESFLDLFPEKRALIPAYRIVAILKMNYLSNTFPEWIERLIGAVLENRGHIPADHPMEQLLPYMILLTPREDLRKKLAVIVKEINFPQNIVEIIKRVLMAQCEYDQEGDLEDATLQNIEKSIMDDIRPQWNKYRLGNVLNSYRTRPDRWHVGPMEILPFNYS